MSLLPNARLLARFLAKATLLGAVIIPCLAVGIWLFWDSLAPIAAGNLGRVYDPATLGPAGRLSGIALFLVGAGAQAYGLLGLRNTFLEAALGRTFSRRAVQGFRRFALVSLFLVFWQVIQHTGVGVILSVSDPSTMGAISIQVGSDEVRSLFMGLLLIFVAHIFAEGKLAKDDVESFL